MRKNNNGPDMANAEKMRQDWIKSQSKKKKRIAIGQANEITKAKRKAKREKKMLDKKEAEKRWEQKPLVQRFKPAKKLRRERSEMIKKEKKAQKLEKRKQKRENQTKKKIEKTCYRRPRILRIAA